MSARDRIGGGAGNQGNPGNQGRPKRLAFRNDGAPKFVIDRDAIVKTQAPSVRYNEPTSRLARRLLRVVPHPEAGASVFGGLYGNRRVGKGARFAPCPPSFEFVV